MIPFLLAKIFWLQLFLLLFFLQQNCCFYNLRTAHRRFMKLSGQVDSCPQMINFESKFQKSKMAAHSGHFPQACFEPINDYISRTPVASLMKFCVQVDPNGYYLHIECDPHRCDVIRGQRSIIRIFGFLAHNSKGYQLNPSKLGGHE